jgi:hypothetical protein
MKTALPTESFFSTKLLTVPKRNTTMNLKFLPSTSSTEFSFLHDVNRPVKTDHVKRMVNSVVKIGIIRPVVITHYKFKNKEGAYILDGQNLYTALKKLNLDIPYVETKVTCDEELVEQIALMNNSSKSWKMKDYVLAWSYIRGDYRKLCVYTEKSTLELVFIAAILLGFKGWTGSIVKKLKYGDFRISNEAKAKKIISFMEDVLSEMPVLSRFIHKRFLSAYLAFVSENFTNYNHKKFIAYMRKNLKLIVQADFKPEKVDEFFQNY